MAISIIFILLLITNVCRFIILSLKIWNHKLLDYDILWNCIRRKCNSPALWIWWPYDAISMKILLNKKCRKTHWLSFKCEIGCSLGWKMLLFMCCCMKIHLSKCTFQLIISYLFSIDMWLHWRDSNKIMWFKLKML